MTRVQLSRALFGERERLFLETDGIQVSLFRYDIAMLVKDIGGVPMDLMYMCHINPVFVDDARIVQPAPWTPESVAVRTAIPAHVPKTPDYVALIDELAHDPQRMEILDPALRYDPEQVFYIHGLRTDAAGQTHVMPRRPDGDGFLISYSPAQFPRTVRWLMHNADQIGAFSPCHASPSSAAT